MSSACMEFEMSTQMNRSMPSLFTFSIFEPDCRLAAPIIRRAIIVVKMMNFVFALADE